jgi:hypothetical protein
MSRIIAKFRYLPCAQKHPKTSENTTFSPSQHNGDPRTLLSGTQYFRGEDGRLGEDERNLSLFVFQLLIFPLHACLSMPGVIASYNRTYYNWHSSHGTGSSAYILNLEAGGRIQQNTL